MKPLRKAQARLERRLAAYARTGKTAEQGFNRPGSTRKPAPKGRS